MNAEAEEYVLSGFLIFCRVGMCFLLLPMFSSPRISTSIRLYFALAVSLAISPLIFDVLRQWVHQKSDLERILSIASELLIGGTFGLLARVFFAALESSAQAISSLVGLTGIFNQDIASDDGGTPLTSLLSLSSVIVFLASDLHITVLHGLLDTYWTLPPDMSIFDVMTISRVTAVFTASFFILLQLCGPFILFALIFNVALGLINKFVLNIPVYFVASPFTIAGGLLLLQLLVKPTVMLFISAFATWLVWR